MGRRLRYLAAAVVQSRLAPFTIELAISSHVSSGVSSIATSALLLPIATLAGNGSRSAITARVIAVRRLRLCCTSASPVCCAPWVIPAGLESDSTRKRAKVESDSTAAKRLESDSNPAQVSTANTSIRHDFVPATEEDLARCLADPMWRLCSGQLYKIMVKSAAQDGEAAGLMHTIGLRR